MKIKFKTKDIIFFAIVAIGLIMFVVQKFSPETDPSENTKLISVTINQAAAVAEVADTDELRYLGLGERNMMDSNHGMLFIHDSPDIYTYSMRGMRFDLDFIFIRENKVVDIAKNVAFEYPGTIKGGTEYDKVLEVNAGWVRATGVKIGDEVVVE